MNFENNNFVSRDLGTPEFHQKIYIPVNLLNPFARDICKVSLLSHAKIQ